MVTVPFPIDGDAYTVSGHCIAGAEARKTSVYYFANRRGPKTAWPGLAKDNRMIFYGLSDYLDYLESQLPVDHEDVDACVHFMKTASPDGGPLPFPEQMWRRVVDAYGGMPPVFIDAIPEGSVFWPQEPIIQVSAVDGFGEIAALIEANLVGMVSNATARATASRHLLERVRDVVREYNPTYDQTAVDSLARWMVHDFGMRASSTPYEAQMYGRAHMLSFHGTDTFSAAFQAMRTGGRRPTGTSILALAHRIVQGHLTEHQAYETLFSNVPEGGYGSYVADCYDFQNAVKNFLVGIASRKRSVVVARPDSGDYIDNTLLIVREALKAGLYGRDEQGRPTASYLRWINGDSMNWEKMERLFDQLDLEGVNPTQWGVFGIGGWLRNLANRDVFSSAYKLSACGDVRPVVKLSETRDKMSIPGPVQLYRTVAGRQAEFPSVFMYNEPIEHLTSYSESVRRPYFDHLGRWASPNFASAQQKAIETFDMYACAADRDNVLSPGVIALQNSEMERHGKTR